MSFTIDSGKELTASYLPLLLYNFQMPDGSFLYLARINVTYGGNAYLGRVLNDDVDTVQMLDQSGVDIASRLRLDLDDADSYILTYYEQASGKGFRGAIVTVTFLFYDPLGLTFSTDSMVRYVGICDAAVPTSDTKLSISTTNKILFQQKQLPTATQQMYCFKTQPQTTAQFAQALVDHTPFWWCGLTAAQYTGPCGNTRAGCVANNNLARFSGLDFQPNQDGGKGINYVSGQKVQLFNIGDNSTYGNPIPLVLGQGWLNAPAINMRQDGNYTRFDVLLCLDDLTGGSGPTPFLQVVCNGVSIPQATTWTGSAWTSYNLGGNPVCWWNWVNYGARSGDTTVSGLRPSGADALGIAEPYGSLAVIEVVVTRDIASGDGEPQIQVMLQGPPIRVYTSPTAYSLQYTNNPAWALMYLLTYAGYQYTDLDIPSFLAAAQICAESIIYNSQYSNFGVANGVASVTITNTGSGYSPTATPTPVFTVTSGSSTQAATGVCFVTQNDGHGNGGKIYLIQITNPGIYSAGATVTVSVSGGGSGSGFTGTVNLSQDAAHQRYICNLIMWARRNAGAVIDGVRRDCCGLLQPNNAGLLSLVIKGTLASQQPVVPDGSNYTTATASLTRNGDVAYGFPAYAFDETNCVSVVGMEHPIADQPNTVSFQFQDSENNFAPTSLTISDSLDTSRIGQTINQNITFDGCGTNDQANRLGRSFLAESLYGSLNNDTRGTVWYEIETSVKAIKIGLGSIVFLSWAKYNLSLQMFRVMKVSGPDHDGYVKLQLMWHNDEWYVDNRSQIADPGYSNPKRQVLQRASYPLCPATVSPRASDPYLSVTDKTFALLPVWTIAPDGTWLGQIQLTTNVPVNNPGLAQPPQVALQANVSTSAGSLPAGQYYVSVVAYDSTGTPSFGSVLCLGSLSGTGEVIVPIKWWDQTNGSSWAIFAGQTPFRLTYQGDGTNHSNGTGFPTTVTLTRYLTCDYGIPDQELDAILPMVRNVGHSGILGAQAAAVTSSTITIGGAWNSTQQGQMAGRVISLLAKYSGAASPPLNYTVSACSSAGVLTVSPNPVTDGIAVGDLFVVRSTPTISGLTWTDPLWANPFYPSGMTPSNEVGDSVYIFQGTGQGQENVIASATSTSHTFANPWNVAPDSTSRIITLESNWQPLTSPIRPVNNSSVLTSINPTFPLANYAGQVILIGMQTEDGGQNPAPVGLMKVREMYIFGKPEGVTNYTA